MPVALLLFGSNVFGVAKSGRVLARIAEACISVVGPLEVAGFNLEQQVSRSPAAPLRRRSARQVQRFSERTGTTPPR